MANSSVRNGSNPNRSMEHIGTSFLVDRFKSSADDALLFCGIRTDMRCIYSFSSGRCEITWRQTHSGLYVRARKPKPTPCSEGQCFPARARPELHRRLAANTSRLADMRCQVDWGHNLY